MPGSEGNVPENKDIPPGIVNNTHAKGLCSDFATSSSESNNQGRGKSRDGNPAHECTPPASTPSGGTTTSGSGGSTVVVSGTTTSNTPSVTSSSSPATSVLGETLTRPGTSAPTSAAPVAATAVQKLPFTGPGHVGVLVGIGLSTLLLGSGLLLATRREALATVSS
ncbi:MAG TPA: hypothetical protein VFA11_06705 [Acidimicrobiales bacterium]|nr:hypothetical protein [Acidimicrobiales bacterium]